MIAQSTVRNSGGTLFFIQIYVSLEISIDFVSIWNFKPFFVDIL
ncbi:hypothetical protein ANACOL_01945 [Anaerotruncus colihominis DSM 17241]|uniref:Uncharacterized protein n=1 Tax=Anaerotruncus colihominis DSM 17241 TaxID=445972 RepID=B0PAZ4_9FIRM|nr:hypothetical protein ANACOL_01945 [Anaerotruncus colihominis DSM 17241]